MEQLKSAQNSAQRARPTSQNHHVTPAPVRTRISKAEFPAIITAYENGATTRQLAQLYNASKNNIEDILHAHGVTMRRRPLTPDQIEEAKALHAQGLSTYAIATKFGVAQSTAWRALRLARSLRIAESGNHRALADDALPISTRRPR